MPTHLALRDIASDLGGAGQFYLSPRAGRTPTTAVTTATASGTNIQLTATAGGTPLSWFSGPIYQSVTVSGLMTVNLRGFESLASVNAGLAVLIEKVDTAGTFISTLVTRRVIGAELGTTNAARVNTAILPTSTTFSNGERIKVTLSLINVGTMGAGTVTLSYNGPIITFPATGDTSETYIAMSEDVLVSGIQDVSPFEIKGSNAYYG